MTWKDVGSSDLEGVPSIAANNWFCRSNQSRQKGSEETESIRLPFREMLGGLAKWLGERVADFI